MIVVSNTSPIINLAIIGQLNLLEKLYQKIFIPESVFHEILTIISKQYGGKFVQKLSWIETHSVTNHSMVNSLLLELDAGEAEAIVLAMEMRAGLLLLDERQGRRVASRLGLNFIGLLGMLIDAKQKGFISAVKPIIDDLVVKAGFWINHRLYARVLQETGE